MDYRKDIFGAECLVEAAKCKSDMRFGAVLVKDNKIIGRGWNRLSTAVERKQMSHIDYAIHAEQSCILDALNSNYDIINSSVYVLGYSNKSATRGALSIRDGKQFTCRKCPHALAKYNLTVNIPTPEGWIELSAAEALESAKQHKNYWDDFLKFGNDVEWRHK